MHNGIGEIGSVGPWIDITNSYQNRWIRAHRWKSPEYFWENHPGLFPATADLHALPGRDEMRPRAPGHPSMGMPTPTGV